MNDEYYEEPPSFGRPIINKPKKKFISDSPPKTNEKPLSLREIKKIEKEKKEKNIEEKEEKKEKEEKMEKEEKEEKNEKKEKLGKEGKKDIEESEENEYLSPTNDISQNNNYLLKENLTIIDIKESNKEQNIYSKNNSVFDIKSTKKIINDSIGKKEHKIEDDYSNTNYSKKLNEEDLKIIIFQFFNNWQLDDIIRIIKYDKIYFEKTFSIILNIGIINCISYPFLNKILIAIIGISIDIYDLEKINYIYDSLKGNIVEHSQDIYSYYVIIALIEAFHKIKCFFLKNFQQNEQFINIIKNCEKKIDFIYSELKENELIKIFMHKNATFVIQYLIDKINKERQEEIFDCAVKNINILINEKIGYFILRQIIEIIPENSKKCDDLIKQIIEYKNFQELFLDKNANFLIKKILKKTKNKYFDLIFSKIKCSICKLAINQYGSYVIEELISVANKKQINEINKEINSYKEILLNNNYGNYVNVFSINMQTLKKKMYLKYNSILPKENDA